MSTTIPETLCDREKSVGENDEGLHPIAVSIFKGISSPSCAVYYSIIRIKNTIIVTHLL